MKTLFNWAGGKTRLISSHYKPFIPNDFTSYHEPFFGAGAMFVHVMTQANPPNKVVINDSIKDIVDIYKAIRDKKDGFLTQLNKLDREYMGLQPEDCKKYFYDLRAENAYHYQAWSPAQEAAVQFFLLRTFFNGKYVRNRNTNGRFGGSFGGPHRRKHSVYDPAAVEWWHLALQGVEIKHGDWMDALPPSKDQNAFTYLDPPYRGAKINYSQSFTDAQQIEVLDFAKGASGHVMVSNQDIGDTFFSSRVSTPLKLESFPYQHGGGPGSRAVKELLIWKAQVT